MRKKKLLKILEQLKERKLVVERDGIWYITDELLDGFKKQTTILSKFENECNMQQFIIKVLIETILKTGPAHDRELYLMYRVLKPLLFTCCPDLEKLFFEERH